MYNSMVLHATLDSLDLTEHKPMMQSCLHVSSYALAACTLDCARQFATHVMSIACPCKFAELPVTTSDTAARE